MWQTRLSREAAARYERDLQVLGLDRSEALRRGLRLLHREALETAMAHDVAAFYADGRAPLSGATAAAYGAAVGSSLSQGDLESGHQPSQPQTDDAEPEGALTASEVGVPSERAPSGSGGSAQAGSGSSGA